LGTRLEGVTDDGQCLIEMKQENQEKIKENKDK
jgi:hypothetical protein